MEYERELTVAKELALRAGGIMLKYFDGDQHIEIKEDNSLVTIADKLINDLVIDELSRSFPNDGIIGEEKSTAEYGGGRKWFCDPIDGTKAYVWGTPTSMFSLGLVVDGRPVLGVAYDPFLKRLYGAVKGAGSFCNGKKIQVSTAPLKDSIVGVTSGITGLDARPYLPKLEREGARFAVFSGAVYKGCLVARGKFSAYLEINIHPHDLAAVEVIVTEAGGKVSNLKGEEVDYKKPFLGAIISNGAVHQKIVELVNS